MHPWAVPHLKFFGEGTVPLSLRPWTWDVMGRELAPSLGGRKNIRWINFQMTFLGKIPFYRPKFLTTFFSDRLYVVCLLSVSTVLNRMYNINDPFSWTKTSISQQKNAPITHFFSQFILCLISNNRTSQNIGVTDAWAAHPPQILGDRSSSSP